MHLVFATRGEKSYVDKFINLLQGVFMPFKWRANDKEELRDVSVQLLVQPIQLYSVVFPKEHKDLVLSTILDDKKGQPNNPKYNKYFWGLRKLLGLQEIPEFDRSKSFPCACAKQNMEVIGIGLKEDAMSPLGFEAL